jgi:hypothetical protein
MDVVMDRETKVALAAVLGTLGDILAWAKELNDGQREVGKMIWIQLSPSFEKPS